MIATSSVVHIDPEILSGTPVFIGTRVPVRAVSLHRGRRAVGRVLGRLPRPASLLALRCNYGRFSAVRSAELSR